MNKVLHCVWCGQSGETVEPVWYEVKGSFGISEKRVELPVHPEHRPQLEAYVQRYNRYALVYVVLILVLTLAMGATVLAETAGEMDTGLIGGLVVCAIGALIAVFPFATPSTTGPFGIKASRWVVRGLGIVVMIGSFVTLIL